MNAERAGSYRKLLERMEQALQNDQQRAALNATADRFRKIRQSSLGELVEGRRRARATKEGSIENLEDNLELLKQRLVARGVKFHFASTGEEAVRQVVEIAKERSVKRVVKSKSLTSEEVDLNRFLEAEGIEVVETDLGERIIQLAGERPSHFTAPAVHKTVQQVAKLFSERYGVEVPPEGGEIASFARSVLRESFLNAEMGIMGCNIAVAETGTIIMITNEGNGRLVSSLPRLLVCITGMEKVVPTMGDACNILDILPKSATGQAITSYVTMISGVEGDENDGKEFHVVVMDNGRSRMKEDPVFRETLYCIRCASCLNACPTYRVVGGHVFGHIYSGPIGLLWTAMVHDQGKAFDMDPLCISCSLCKDACPVGIDIPMMIASVKQADIRENGEWRVNRILGDAESSAKLLSRTAPVSNWVLQSSLGRWLLERLAGISSERRLPEFHRQTFQNWYGKNRRRISRVSTDGPGLVYFTDLYANYNDPRLGRMAVEVLERNGIRVEVPRQRASGMPYVSYGYLDKARRIAEYNVQSLAEHVRNGAEIFTTEPTAAFCLKEVYPALLKNRDAELVSAKTHELTAVLLDLHQRNRLNLSFRKSQGRIAYHQPCHSRPLSPDRPAVTLLKLMGYDVTVLDQGCCGMAGTYGLKKGLDGYGMSMEIGKALFQDVLSGGYDFLVTESSVCRMQIIDGTRIPVHHPVSLLHGAYEGNQHDPGSGYQPTA